MACSDGQPPAPAPDRTPLERVDRLELRGAGAPAMVEARGETRMAALLDVGASAELCVPEAEPEAPGRVLSFGMRTSLRSGTELLVRLGREERKSVRVGSTWRDIEMPVPDASACFVLELSGKPGTQAAISTALLRQPGRRRPWVIVYVVDTLRFDFTPYANPSHGESELAPALQALAADGIVYERVFSTSSWTRPTAATLLTGLGPSLHRVYDRQDRLPAAVGRLPSWLAELGWFTEAISSNPNVLPLWGFMPGFDRFVDIGSDQWAAHQDFDTLTQRVLHRFSQAADQPLFLYVHDNEPHSPYRPAPVYRRLFGAPAPGSPAEIPQYSDDAERMRHSRALYRASIRSMSDRLAEMVTGLKRVGRYDDSLIVLVGDHGEEFGEHGSVLHGKTLYQEQLHVPLVIKAPARAAAFGTVDTPVSTESVVSTLLHFLEIDGSSSSATARLPLPGEEGRDATLFSELALDEAHWASAVLWPWKYLRDGAESELLFDLASDPEERHDVSADQQEVVRSLRSALDRRRALASAGLALGCVAGPEPATARLQLELGTERSPEFEALGLEAADHVRAETGRLNVALSLRPAVPPAVPVAIFRASVAARAQPDRDLVRLPRVDEAALSIRSIGDEAPVRIEAADGSELALGEPISLTRLAVSVAPALPQGRQSAVCVVYYLVPPSEVAGDEEVDPQLRARLRALGYLQ
jgi:arylsulfatase A-like enzyme